MIRLTIVILCGGLLFLQVCLPLHANSRVSTFRLANGLRVILSPVDVDNVDAACVLLYHLTGVRDDPPGIKGASYLFQNLMLLGTQNLDVYDRIVYIKRNGGISDRIVNYDYSIFYQVIPASEINTALWLESERIHSLELSGQNISIEKNNIYSRNYRLINSNVNFKTLNHIKAIIFENTIYETPIYGNLEEIRKFDNRAVIKLYRNFKNLSNIIMVIAGKFDNEEIKKSIIKYFGGILPQSLPRPHKKNYVPIEPRKKYVYENLLFENLSEPFVLYGIRAPSKFSNDYLYFDFIRFYLVDERISRLEYLLNKSNKLDVTISYHYTGHFESNALIIKISARRRVNLERAKYFVNKELAALIKGKQGTLSNTDMKVTKSLMEIDFLKKMSLLEQRSIFLAENYYMSGQLNGVEKYLKELRKINSYDIYRIARRYLGKDNRVNLNVYPK